MQAVADRTSSIATSVDDLLFIAAVWVDPGASIEDAGLREQSRCHRLALLAGAETPTLEEALEAAAMTRSSTLFLRARLHSYRFLRPHSLTVGWPWCPPPRQPTAAASSDAAAEPDEPLVVAKDLVKRFGDFVAVDHIDFEIAKGESFGFLGPNGAGKTSTMRMISCMSPLSDGTLRASSGWTLRRTALASGAESVSCHKRTASTSSSPSSTT